jgi:hypothetical protein
MTATQAQAPWTIRDFLFTGLGESGAPSAAGTLDRQGVTAALHGALPRQLGSEARSTVDREFAAAVDSLLNLDLLSMLTGAWTTYKRLTDAAERTLVAPQAREVVPVATHQVTCEYHPYVEILLDGAPTARFPIDLSTIFKIDALVAVITQGYLTELASGRCHIEVALSWRGIELAGRQGEYDLHLIHALRQPIPLRVR